MKRLSICVSPVGSSMFLGTQFYHRRMLHPDQESTKLSEELPKKVSLAVIGVNQKRAQELGIDQREGCKNH